MPEILSQPIRVIIADDHPVVRAGLVAILSGSPQIKIVAEVGDGPSLMRVLAQQAADVLILDLGMPGRAGLALLRQIRGEAPKLRIVVCSMYESAIYGERSLQLGAVAYVDKNVAPQKLLATIFAAAQAPVGPVPAGTAESASEPPHKKLSDRQYEVFALLVQGKSVTDIAEMLHLSIKTVSTHKVAVQRRLGAESIVDLVKYASQHGLIDPLSTTVRRVA